MLLRLVPFWFSSLHFKAFVFKVWLSYLALDQDFEAKLGMENQAFFIFGLLKSAWDQLQKMRLDL